MLLSFLSFQSNRFVCGVYLFTIFAVTVSFSVIMSLVLIIILFIDHTVRSREFAFPLHRRDAPWRYATRTLKIQNKFKFSFGNFFWWLILYEMFTFLVRFFKFRMYFSLSVVIFFPKQGESLGVHHGVDMRPLAKDWQLWNKIDNFGEVVTTERARL